MLQNRIVRALVGAVFAKAAVAAGWYLYQKSLKNESDWTNKDKKVNDETVKNEAEEIKSVVVEKAPVIKKTPLKVVSPEVSEKEVKIKETVKKKPVSKVKNAVETEDKAKVAPARKRAPRKVTPKV